MQLITELDVSASLPFPILHIQRIQSGFYNWALSIEGQLFEQEEGISSIQECLRQAFRSLPEDGSAVEIRYRGIGLGTFSAKAIQEAPDMLADKIVEMYSEVMSFIA